MLESLRQIVAPHSLSTACSVTVDTGLEIMNQGYCSGTLRVSLRLDVLQMGGWGKTVKDHPREAVSRADERDRGLLRGTEAEVVTQVLKFMEDAAENGTSGGREGHGGGEPLAVGGRGTA